MNPSHRELIRQVLTHNRTTFQYVGWSVRVWPTTTTLKDGRQPVAEARPLKTATLPDGLKDKWLANPDPYDPARPNHARQMEYGLRNLLAQVDRYVADPDQLKAG